MNRKQLVGDQTMETKIDELFDKLDDNENEKITKDEFVRNCANNVFLRETLMPNILRNNNWNETSRYWQITTYTKLYRYFI